MSKTKDKGYLWLYVLGLLSTSILGFWKAILVSCNYNGLHDYISAQYTVTKLVELKEKSTWNNLLIIIPVILIFVMFVWAKIAIKFNKAKNGTEALFKLKSFYKDYIQLAGYIQTLIGFFIAILSLVPITQENISDSFEKLDISPPDLTLVAFPIGMALITSIFGWAFGSLIATPDNEYDDNLNKSVKTLKESLDELTKEVLLTKVKYEKSTETFVTNSSRLYKKQEQVITQYNASLETLRQTNKDYTQEVKATLNDIKKDLRAYQEIYEKAILELTQKILSLYEESQKEIKEKITEYYSELAGRINRELDKISELDKMIADYLEALKEGFKGTLEEISQFKDLVKKYNEAIINNTKLSNEFLSAIKTGIENIDPGIIGKLYESQNLKKDIQEVKDALEALHESVRKKDGFRARLIKKIFGKGGSEL